MDSLSYKTKSERKEDVVRAFWLVDAEDLVIGRMASQVAHVLKGKHKPSYTPHIDTGDHVVIINAEKARFTGNKMDDKVYLTFSGYPGGQKSKTAKEIRDKNPILLLEYAVKGMLPKNRLGRAMFKKLHVYAGGEHPHAAQKPQSLKIK